MSLILILVTVVTLLVLLLRFLRHKKIDLSHIPGPSFNPWLQVFRKQDGENTHIMLGAIAKQYGAVLKIPDLGTDTLLISCFDEIYQVLVKEGVNFGGRCTSFCLKSTLGETGIIHNLTPDAKWKSLRKITQQHLRQFSDGMSRIEDIVKDIANTMFSDFERNADSPYCPYDIIYDSVFANIASLIIGHKTDDQVLMKMREFTEVFFETTSMKPSKSLMILDFCPWLQHLKWPAMKIFHRFNRLESEIWNYAKAYAKANPEAHSICPAFEGHSYVEERDATKTTLTLLFAGVNTTSYTFYGLINVLAHNKDVQKSILDETVKIQEETGRDVSLQDRPEMPYTRAVLLEALRYLSIAPIAQHESLKEMHIGGYKIPAKTQILISLWTLHHDEDFWDEPFSFKPDRFLDDQGELVPADHPNRKHLMPFGAGTRVCVGESLAMARLFLLMVNLVQRLEISPAPGNDKTSIDPRGHKFDGLLKHTAYKVVFSKRN